MNFFASNQIFSGWIAAIPILVALCCGRAEANVPGALDPNFGVGTGVTAPIVLNGPSAKGVSLLIQADGQTVVTGGCYASDQSALCAHRFDQRGTIDRSFGAGAGSALISLGDDIFVSGGAAALQGDQKIVLAGTCTGGGVASSRGCVARLNPDGTADTSFGQSGATAGRLVIPSDISAGIEAIAVQSDGKLLLLGRCRYGSFCVARLTSTGQIDTTYPTNTPGTGFLSVAFPSGRSPVGLALALQSDGKIVLVGTCIASQVPPPAETDYAFCIARLNSNGSLDSTFIGPDGTGKGAIVVNPTTAWDVARAVAIQADGKIVVTGECDRYSTCIVRINVDGSLDSTLIGPSGTDKGLIRIPWLGGYTFSRAVAIQNDGKIVLGGRCDEIPTEVCVARFNSNGTVDTPFGGAGLTGGGVAHFKIGGQGADLTAIRIDASGRIIVSGTRYDIFPVSLPFAARLLSTGDDRVTSLRAMVEYRYLQLDYYFITSRDSDKAALDSLESWRRTGNGFYVLVNNETGSSPITRFYFDQVAKNKSRGSHFYTLLPSEVAAVQALNPSNSPALGKPVNEGIDSYAYLPSASGTCATGWLPVYRLFRGNARFPDDPNHRFTTGLADYNDFVGRGWDGEGVKFCVPQ